MAWHVDFNKKNCGSSASKWIHLCSEKRSKIEEPGCEPGLVLTTPVCPVRYTCLNRRVNTEISNILVSWRACFTDSTDVEHRLLKQQVILALCSFAHSCALKEFLSVHVPLSWISGCKLMMEYIQCFCSLSDRSSLDGVSEADLLRQFSSALWELFGKHTHFGLLLVLVCQGYSAMLKPLMVVPPVICCAPKIILHVYVVMHRDIVRLCHICRCPYRRDVDQHIPKSSQIKELPGSPLGVQIEECVCVKITVCSWDVSLSLLSLATSCLFVCCECAWVWFKQKFITSWSLRRTGCKAECPLSEHVRASVSRWEVIKTAQKLKNL